MEDEPAHAEAIRRAFASADAAIRVVATLRAYREAVAALPPDIAVMDLTLPDGRAIEALTSPAGAGPFPIVVMTSFGDEHTAVEAMKAGALDYVVKSTETFAAMPRTVEGALREWRLLNERKRAQDALKDSEARYRDLVEHSSDLICTHDLKGVLLSVNAAAARASGFSPEEAVGLHLHALVPRERRPEVDLYLDTIRRAGAAAGIMKVVTRAGDVRYWEYRNTLRTEGVEAPVVRGVARDVTEQVLARRALAKSEAKYRAILDNIEESYYEVDVAGNLTFFNDSLCRLLGYARDELQGMNNRQYTNGENAEKLYRAFNAVFRTGEPTRGLDWEIIRKNGTKRTIEASVSLRGDAAGKPIGFRGMIRDVTEHKQAEKILRKSEADLQCVLGATADGILAIDGQRRVVLTNRRFAEIWHIPHGVVESRDDHVLLKYVLDQLTDPEAFLADVEALYCSDQEDMATLLFKDGRVLERFSSPMMLEGSVAGRVWSFRDITERKRAEEALEHSQAQLLQAQKMEAVGRLAGGVAHDFNNILQAMLSLATVLRLRAASPELAKTVAEIEALIKRGAGLTQQLLLFSRRQVAERKRLDLGRADQRGGPLLRRLIPENIRLTVETTPERLWVDGDAGQLQQVLMNLAVNARDAMPAGGTLTVRTSGGDGEAVIEVIDTGHGMDEETRSHLFEPFFTTKEPGKGTGLGLSVVHGIVEQHGGRIEVESAPGEGSRFRVVLPTVPAPDAAAEGAERRDGAAARGRRAGAGRRGRGRRAPRAGRDPRDARLPGDRGGQRRGGGRPAGRAGARSPAHRPHAAGHRRHRAGGGPARSLAAHEDRADVRLHRGRGGPPRRRAREHVHFLQKPFDMAALARELHAALGSSR